MISIWFISAMRSIRPSFSLIFPPDHSSAQLPQI
jgi:hypothetical protein